MFVGGGADLCLGQQTLLVPHTSHDKCHIEISDVLQYIFRGIRAKSALTTKPALNLDESLFYSFSRSRSRSVRWSCLSPARV